MARKGKGWHIVLYALDLFLRGGGGWGGRGEKEAVFRDGSYLLLLLGVLVNSQKKNKKSIRTAYLSSR